MTDFAPIKAMHDRVVKFGADSDTNLFMELVYEGELILKTTVASFVAAVENDRQSHQYRLLHSLVRADGIGDWARALDDIFSGPTSQHLSKHFHELRRVFTDRTQKGQWQYEAVQALVEVTQGIQNNEVPVLERYALRMWFHTFCELRNKSRGHGALTPAACSKYVLMLDRSIALLRENNPIYALSWAYLHRNFSGRYRTVPLGGNQERIEWLKSAKVSQLEKHLPNGIYLFQETFFLVPLIFSDGDASDFFMPNGAFRNGSFELHSLISDSRQVGDATPYLAPATERPASETEGKSELFLLNNAITNMPKQTEGYVTRDVLQDKLFDLLINDRHPIITLVGRGGIGKTSLALAILQQISKTHRFDLILWFSARDVDLLLSGAKLVQPRVLTDKDIADQYVELVAEKTVAGQPKKSNVDIMAQHLRENPHGKTLFVLDNFETVRSPVDLFNWIDLNIRLPNKAFITSRFRDFKADYPVEVSGMEPEEALKLANQTIRNLGIEALFSQSEIETIIDESDRHPYVMKILLGEIADLGKFAKPSNLLAKKDDILDALFERTYANLNPLATRIFLTLSSWRSIVPQLAVEAALLRNGSDAGDPTKAIDQLIRMSLVERTVAGDDLDVLEVPLAAALFGRKKLDVSPIRPHVSNDVQFLQDIGGLSTTALKDGLKNRLNAFFRKTARRISDGKVKYEETRPVLEFFGRNYPLAWYWLFQLEQEIGGNQSADRASEYLRRYLETTPPPSEARAAWQQLVNLYQMADDAVGCCSAFLEAARISKPDLEEISSVINIANNSSSLKLEMGIIDRQTLLQPLAELMENHLSEASATDVSRLAWLYLHCGNEQKALHLSRLGLEKEFANIHCQRLYAKLSAL